MSKGKRSRQNIEHTKMTAVEVRAFDGDWELLIALSQARLEIDPKTGDGLLRLKPKHVDQWTRQRRPAPEWVTPPGSGIGGLLQTIARAWLPEQCRCEVIPSQLGPQGLTPAQVRFLAECPLHGDQVGAVVSLATVVADHMPQAPGLVVPDDLRDLATVIVECPQCSGSGCWRCMGTGKIEAPATTEYAQPADKPVEDLTSKSEDSQTKGTDHE